ncbi:hypothetical protein [Desulfocurvus sp. DL9XJH121]
MLADAEGRIAPPVPAAPAGAVWPVRVELVAEDREGRVVTRRLVMEPGLSSFRELLTDLDSCGYRGLVLRRLRG